MVHGHSLGYSILVVVVVVVGVVGVVVVVVVKGIVEVVAATVSGRYSTPSGPGLSLERSVLLPSEVRSGRV